MSAQQQHATPTRKVMAASIGSAVSIILIYLIEAEFSFAVDLPGAVEGAITTLTTFLFGYYVPPSMNDAVVESQTKAL